MKELQKYIFDPKNPKGCKVYDLLLKIVKEQNNAVFISPMFLLTIFENEIFDAELIKSLWDKPDNFSELDLNSKIRVYEENFSKMEFVQLLYKKYYKQLFSSNKLKSLFNSFWKFENLQEAAFIRPVFLDDKITIELTDYILFGHDLKGGVIVPEFKKNNILFLNKELFYIANDSQLDLSSIIITTLEEYTGHPIIVQNLKPLLLKDAKDVHILLDVLYRDLMQEKAKEQNQVEDIHYLKNITIKNFFSIKDLKLHDLANKKEIYFVGENGDGKTALLQAITLALKGDEQQGLIVDFIRQNSSQELMLKAADNARHNYSFTEIENNHSYKNLFAYGAHRHRNDSDKAEEKGYLTLFNDEQYLNNPVKWLQHLDYKQAKGEETSISLEKAKELLKSILDNNVEIEVSPDEVAFIERGTRLKFEQLSEGYKSVIIWVSDLIKRLSDNQPYVASTEDFRGIVLVDEIELHLHPKWKYRIVKDLRTWFPKIQFIFTTHSPTVVLGASPDAVFYKVYKEEGITKISSPIKDISHLTANSLLTSPLFELESMTPRSNNLAEIKNISNDDYIYQKIHQAVAEKINNTPNLVDADVMRMVEEELKKLESEK